MAQAPQGGGASGGAPRQNKTIKQFQGMNTQTERMGIPEGAFHWLENIQPIGTSDLHSIPGRGSSQTVIPPPATCFPPPQTLTEVAYLGTAIDVAINPGCATRGFVDTGPTGETIFELTHNNLSTFTTWSIVNGVVTDLGIPGWINPANLGICPNYLSGYSDRPAFFQTKRLYDYNANTEVLIDWSGSGTNPDSPVQRLWGLNGNFFYAFFPQDVSIVTGPLVTKHNATTGAWITKSTAPYPDNIWRQTQAFGLTADRVFAMYNHFTTPVTPPIVLTIKIYDAASLAELGSYDTANNTWRAMNVVTDDLIYLIRSAIAPPGVGNYVDIHYIKNIQTTPVEVTLCHNILLSPGDSPDVGQNFVFYSGLIGTQRFLYYAQDFNGAVHKIGPVHC